MDRDSDEEYISIGELARTIGVTTRTLRYYEEVGIMEASHRIDGGNRAYSASGVRKLKFILRLKEMGLSIKEMQELDAAYAEAKQTNKIIPRLVEMLDFHINTLDDKMSKLAQLRKEIVDYRHSMIERFRPPRAG
jgi:DNA-binding transcriptional MerR regulator